MNFLFLDLSTKSTGYAISDDKGKLITYGLLTASSSNNISRIQKIQSGIIELVKQYNIEKLIGTYKIKIFTTDTQISCRLTFIKNGSRYYDFYSNSQNTL